MASHIGKLPIAVPAGVEITVNGSIFQAKGPKGTDSFELPEGISVSVEDGHVTFTPEDDARPTRAKHGLARSLAAGILIVGTGYRVVAKGKNLEFFLGYSHTINVEAPAGIEFEVVNPNELLVKGIDKQAVGQIAANIRKLRAPEPYKGKGIKYADERIIRKAGKAGK